MSYQPFIIYYLFWVALLENLQFQLNSTDYLFYQSYHIQFQLKFENYNLFQIII